jgi:hypothetical protein
MDTILTLAALVILLALNLWATRKVVSDEAITKQQRRAQLAIVWLLPLLGALVVFGIHRATELPSRKYRDAADPGDDYAISGKSVRATTDILHSD